VDEMDGRHDLTPTGRMKRPTISQVCEWAKTLWELVKQEIVVKSFKKCGVSNALDGTEVNVLFEESESSDSNNDIDSSDEDFRGFCDQYKLHTALPFCV
jgi:hypothetical protein